MAKQIQKLRNIGMMQYNFLYEVEIPYIPGIGGNNLKFLVRTASIPGKTKSAVLMRYNDEEIRLPAGNTLNSHDWSVTYMMEESGRESYDIIKAWDDYVDENSVGGNVVNVKTDVIVRLLAKNKTTVNKTYKLTGVFPMGVPNIDGLDFSGTDGIINLTFNFNVDDVEIVT